MYIIIYETDRQSRFDAWDGAQGWCTGMTQRDAIGREWEADSGWGTHVHPWLIHVNVWQKPQYCEVISFQLKLKKKILPFTSLFQHLPLFILWSKPSLTIPSLRVIPVHQPRAPCLMHQTALVIYFTYGNIHVSMLFCQIIPPSPPPTESKRLLYTSVSLSLSHIQGCHYHLSKFHIYMH